MSTRSLIGIQREKDKFEVIYCHSDGYPTYNGAMLLDHYSDKEKVERLVSLCNSLNLSPMHLDDVVEDFLTDLEI